MITWHCTLVAARQKETGIRLPTRAISGVSSPLARRHFPFARVLFYYGPLAAWLTLSLLLATSFGRYDNTVSLLYMLLTFMAPETESPDVNHMYGLTFVARESAYVLEYGVIALLLVRALQGGAERLRRRSLLGVAIFGILFALVDNGVRTATPGRHGGWNDLTLSLGNVAFFTGLISLFFALKSWERRRFLGETDSESGTVQ